MSNLTDRLINTERLTELHQAAAQHRRAQEPDVIRRIGARAVAARMLRSLADRIDYKRPRTRELYGQVGSN